MGFSPGRRCGAVPEIGGVRRLECCRRGPVLVCHHKAGCRISRPCGVLARRTGRGCSMSIVEGSGTKSRLRAAISAIGLAGVGLIAVVVAFGDVIARVPAGAVKVGPPSLPPQVVYAFGTDALGRDVMSETVHALTVTFSSAVLATIIAIVVGAIAGFAAVRAPLRLGIALRGIMGVFGSVPVLLLAVVAVGIAGHEFAPIAAGLAASPSIFNRSFDRAMRLARSRHAEYARATGIPASTLLRRDLVYEVRGNFLNVAGRALASTTIALATLGF